MLTARRVLSVDPLLAFLAVGSALLFVGTVIGLADDPRVITGVPAWLKPMKFAISMAIYATSLLWLLSFVDGHRRLVRLAATLTAVTGTIELAIIVGQVVRGTTSHFNVTTPLDGTLFGIMGGSIVVLWTMALLVGILLLRQQFAEPAFAWSLRLAVVLSLAGMAVAFLMVNPTSEQTAVLATGAVSSVGAHSVGVADGGPGIPIVNWSTIGGDLRVPHFVGIHALQVLPVIGWLLARGGRHAPGRTVTVSMDATHRAALVWVVGGLYAGLIGLLTWQALRGQSVVAPDGQTLTALGALVGGAALACVAVVGHAAAVVPDRIGRRTVSANASNWSAPPR